MTRATRRVLGAAILAIAAGVVLVVVQRADGRDREAELLVKQLDIHPGSIVGEVGAGDGELALEIARRVGPAGRVFATELDPKRLENIGKASRASGLGNITVVRAAEDRTVLDDGCCDAIYLRRVFHHFTKPAEMNASLYRSLRPGGRLAVIEGPPSRILNLIAPVNGAPSNRSGHGMTKAAVEEELRNAGFTLVRTIDWPDRMYCVVARRPE